MKRVYSKRIKKCSKSFDILKNIRNKFEKRRVITRIKDCNENGYFI